MGISKERKKALIENCIICVRMKKLNDWMQSADEWNLEQGQMKQMQF